MQKRPIFNLLIKRVQEQRRFIQVLLGPRQVGKTTLAIQVTESLDKPFHFISADLATLQDLAWLQQQWEVARLKVVKGKGCILIIDEVQKIPHWSDLIKSLWDSDTRNGVDLSVIILGSSPWLVQKGLTESLAGRFEIIPITHWSYDEMHKSFGWTLEKYAYFGGYPGAASLADENETARWTNYINDSIIETTISRDILLMTQVNKPALLRRLFRLGCIYSGQILSYTKMLGQLQENGNTTTLAHYYQERDCLMVYKNVHHNPYDSVDQVPNLQYTTRLLCQHNRIRLLKKRDKTMNFGEGLLNQLWERIS